MTTSEAPPRVRPSDGRLRTHLLLAALLQLVACAFARADTLERPAIRVALAPVANTRMSGIAWRALTEECTRIWAREGVALSWRGAADGSDVVLPLVFDEREVRKHDRKSDEAFGVTLFLGRSQRIVVSIARARLVVSQRHGLADSGDGMTLDIAMGRLLGRVVAHEIGHAILLTTRHAAEGLMNARLDGDDLRPSADGQFALSAPDRSRLAVRFSNLRPSAPRGADVAAVTWMDAPPAPSQRRARR